MLWSLSRLLTGFSRRLRRWKPSIKAKSPKWSDPVVLTAFAFDGTSFTHHLCSSSHVEQMLNLEQSSGVVARLVWEPGFQILNHISFEHRRFNLRETIHVNVAL